MYGRDQEVADLLDLVIAERVVLLYSPSGAGKSSLLATGLAPRLRAEGFSVRPVTRVGQPLPAAAAGGERHLLSALLGLEQDVPPERQLSLAELATLTLGGYLDRRRREDGADADVLIIDQFEEILSADLAADAERLAFFAELGRALRDSRRYAVLAMREDWIAGLDPYRAALPTRLRTTFRLELLGPAAALAAIREPSRACGVEFSEAAAHRLVDDLRQTRVPRPDGNVELRTGPRVEPVQLQVVCLDLWSRLPPDTRVIDVADLAAVGDVDHALAGYYDAQAALVARRSGVPERLLRAWIECHLITQQNLRGQVLLTPGTTQGLANAPLHALVDAHLLRVDERRGMQWFELAHDRLVAPLQASNRRWARDELGALEQQAALWDSQGRGEGLLLTDSAELERARQVPDAARTAAELEFLAESRRVSARQARERRSARFIRVLAVVATLGLVAAVLGLVLTVLASRRAQERALEAEVARQDAEAQQTLSLARQLAAQALTVPRSEYEVAALLAIAASDLSPPATARGPLSDLLERWPHFAGLIRLGYYNGDMATIRVDPGSGTILIAGGGDGMLFAWDPTRRELAYQGDFSGQDLAIAPRSRHFATADSDHQLRIFDLGTGALRREQALPLAARDWASALAYSPDEQQIAIGTEKGALLLVSASDGAVVWRQDGAAAGVWALSFIDGGLMLVDSAGRIVRYDLGTHQVTAELAVPGTMNRVAVQPGLPLAAIAYVTPDDGGQDWLVIADLARGTRQELGRSHDASYRALALHPAGTAVAVAACTGRDELCVGPTLAVWNLPDLRPRLQLALPTIAVGLAFDQTGDRVVVGTNSEPLPLFDVRAPVTLGPYLRAAAQTRDGERVAIAGPGAEVGLWSLDPPTLQASFAGSQDLRSLAFLADDTRLAAHDRRGITVWDVASHELHQQIPLAPDTFGLALAGQTGRLFAFAANVYTIRDGVTGEPLRTLPDPADLSGYVASAWSADGETLATARCHERMIDCVGSEVQLWRGADEPPQALPPTSQQIAALAFAPDGKDLFAVADAGLLRWRVSGGEPTLTAIADSNLSSLRVTPDGAVVVAAGSTGRSCPGGTCLLGALHLFAATTLDPLAAPILREPAPFELHAVGPEARHVLVTSGFGSAVWNLEFASLRRRACELAGRELSPAEWTRYLGTRPWRPLCAAAVP